MMAQLSRTPIRQDHPPRAVPPPKTFNIVGVSSEDQQTRALRADSSSAQAFTFRLLESGDDRRRVSYRRISAHAVGSSAAWLLRRSGRSKVHTLTAGAFSVGPRGLADLPCDAEALRELLRRDQTPGLDQEAIAAAILALRGADAVIVGPLSAADSNTPGLVAHLADLSIGAYRALRPPRELVVHAGFAQVARRFQFIQMSHNQARALAAGALDIGVLGHRLRQMQGDEGEFAITAFGGHGLLRADGKWWEIESSKREIVDENRAGAAFCAAWVVARSFLDAAPARALAYARSAALNSCAMA
jgi:hypothetical protein